MKYTLRPCDTRHVTWFCILGECPMSPKTRTETDPLPDCTHWERTYRTGIKIMQRIMKYIAHVVRWDIPVKWWSDVPMLRSLKNK